MMVDTNFITTIIYLNVSAQLWIFFNELIETINSSVKFYQVRIETFKYTIAETMLVSTIVITLLIFSMMQQVIQYDAINLYKNT